MLVFRAVVLFVAAAVASAAVAGQAPPPPTPEQLKANETFRGWVTRCGRA